MILNDRCFAPQIGVWNVSHHRLPDMGEVVLGLVWNSQGGAAIALMEWRIVEDGEEYDPDHVFLVSDRKGDHQEREAAWFLAFSEDEDSVFAPLLWAEARFIIPTPFKVCEECDGLTYTGGCDDEEPEA